MMCDHSGTYSGASQYLREAGELRLVLLCDQCGKLVPFHDPALERSIDQLSSRLGFRTTDHEVTLRGDCPDCS